MELKRFLDMPNCVISKELRSMISESGNNTLTPFENKNDILYSRDLQKDMGYSQFESGDWLVSVTCEMPDVTKEMVDWWFWWHPQENIRYKIWFPGEHYAVGYSKKDRAYFSSEKQPPFKENIQYPVERIGKLVMPLSIHFTEAEHFGFTQSAIKDNSVETVVCGHVGALYGLVSHTEMCHIFFKRDGGGLTLVSRFWIGKRLRNPLLRKVILTEETAKGMAEHCYIEYSNFARRIPELFNEYKR